MVLGLFENRAASSFGNSGGAGATSAGTDSQTFTDSGDRWKYRIRGIHGTARSNSSENEEHDQSSQILEFTCSTGHACATLQQNVQVDPNVG